jgi:hypothetical protein
MCSVMGVAENLDLCSDTADSPAAAMPSDQEGSPQ